MAVASVLAGAVHQSLDFLPGEVPAGSACRTVKFTVVSAVFLDAGNIEGVSENRAAFAAKEHPYGGGNDFHKPWMLLRRL